MAEFAKVVSSVARDAPDLEIIALFCGIGLLVSLISVIYGLDLNSGMF